MPRSGVITSLAGPDREQPDPATPPRTRPRGGRPGVPDPRPLAPRTGSRAGWRRWQAVPALLAVALVVGSCSNKPPEAKAYVAKLEATRAAKDAWFANGSDSPIPPARRATLLPLAYFPIDPDYDVPAVLTPSDDPAIFKMPTSSGTPRDMRRVGSLDFTLKGQPLKLLAFVEVDTPDTPVRGVQRSDERHGNLCRRPLRGHRAEQHGDLRNRLQSRVQPVLLLQRLVRVPVPACREPAQDSDPRRGTDRSRPLS